MTFTINQGTKEGAIEISFSERPSEEVRTAIKGLKMRWNNAKSVWWGFVDEQLASDTIKEADSKASQEAAKTVEEIQKEFFTTVSDGYMGAYEFTGSKSQKYLYGAELSKAIRQDLKRVGIKATARTHTYAGGQTLTVTLEVSKADFVSEADYVAQYNIWDSHHSFGWVYLPGTEKNVPIEDLTCGDRYTEEQREEIRVSLAKEEYSKYWESGKKNSWGSVTCVGISPHRHKDYPMFTTEAYKRFELAEKVIQSYHHNDSNAMVDYFDVNFYYDLVIKNIDREQDKP